METVQPGHSSSTMLAEASLGNSQRLTAALLSQDAPRESKAGLKRPRSAAHVTLPPRPAKKSTPVAVVAPSPIIPSPICAYCTGGPHHCVKTDAPEILISCNECGSSGHPSCLDWDNDDTMLLVTVQTYDWKCINCKSCERCQRKDESVMMCDRCDRGWHLGCLDPPLKNVPEGIWSCPTCVQSDVQAANGNGQPRKGIHQPQPSSSLHEPTSRFKTRPAHASAMRRLSMAKVVPSSSESGQLSQDSSAEPSRRNSVISLKLTLGSRRSSGAETATAELEAEQDPTLGRGLSDAARSNDGTEDRGTAGGGQKHQRTKSSGWEGGESGGNRTGSSRNDRGQSQRSNPIGGKTEDGNGSDSSSAHGPSRSSSPGLSYDVDGDEDSDEAAQADEGEEAEEVVEEEEQEDPFGGIISGEDADTSKTVPSQADIERFEQSKQSAEAKLGGAVVSLAGSSSGGRSARRSSLGRLVLTSPGPSSVAVSAVRISPRSRPSTLETPSRSRQGSHPANETPASASPAVSAPPNSDPVNQATSAQTGTASPIKCIRFGEYDIDTWYQAPYPEEYSMVPDGRLWICEFCLKYMKSRFMASRHRTKCKMRHPPGDEIYRDGGISIFEVDGRKNKIYCQNLCLLAKMFLDHKTLYYDVEPFLFYVVTEVNHLGAHFVGYFSKEKRSSMSYNLSCIMTLPIRQRRGWGNYLIDISYLLSKKEGRVGSPEKPLSDLGLLSYRNYWTLAVFYYLRTAPDRVTMNEISAATAMTLEDVFYVLREQDMLSLPDSPSGRMRTPATSKYRGREGPSTPAATPTPRPRGRPRKNPETPRDHKHKPNGAAPLPTEYRIHFDRDYVNAHLKNYEAKGYLKVRPEKLKWTPFLMARSSVPAKMPTIQSLASSLRSLPDSQTAEEVTHGASLGKDTNTADGPGGPEATPDDKQRIGSSQSISAAPKMDASPDQSRPRGRKALKRQAVEEAAEVPLQPAVQSSDRSAGLENTLGLSYALPDMATLTSAEAAPFTATRLPFDPSFQHAYALSPKLAPDAQETPAMDERPSTEACGSSAALALNFEASSSADNVAGNAAAAADPGANNADADPSANACDQRTMSEATSPAQGHLLTDLEDAVHHPQTSHPEDAMSIPFDASMIDPSLMMGSDGAGNVDVDGTDEDAPGSDDPEMAL